MRDRWDDLVGHLGLLVVNLGLWRDMQFASFGHYCAERLGMSARAVEQRVALERRLYFLPALRVAMRDRRVSYEQARLVAAHADDRNVLALIARAEETTAIALRRELDAAEQAQMRARAELDLRVPKRVGALLDAAVRSARKQAGRWIPSGEALALVAKHFADTWREAVKVRNTRRNQVIARDNGFCQVPGCSRAGGHSHHIISRAAGGSDDKENQVGTCPPHHLHAIHRGYVRVSGRAPDHLAWELGVRPDS
jgi:5-methylcytosine-specific restriction endonuclease McrA